MKKTTKIGTWLSASRKNLGSPMANYDIAYSHRLRSVWVPILQVVFLRSGVCKRFISLRDLHEAAHSESVIGVFIRVVFEAEAAVGGFDVFVSGVLGNFEDGERVETPDFALGSCSDLLEGEKQGAGQGKEEQAVEHSAAGAAGGAGSVHRGNFVLAQTALAAGTQGSGFHL